MTSSNYTRLAAIYPHLMRLIGYNGWAAYILELTEYLEILPEKVLEIAAGNGKISSKLRKAFNFYVISDVSKEMLRSNNDPGLNKVCCDMICLPFNVDFDLIFSTFDSVNYLTTEAQIIRLFEEVGGALSDDGYFTFDVSLENNSRRHEEKLNRKGVYKGIKYIQKSRYDADKKLHYNDFVLEDKSGKIYRENHVQRIYDFEDYFGFIEGTGLYIKYCFDTFTFDIADKYSERVQFILTKRSRCLK